MRMDLKLSFGCSIQVNAFSCDAIIKGFVCSTSFPTPVYENFFFSAVRIFCRKVDYNFFLIDNHYKTISNQSELVNLPSVCNSLERGATSASAGGPPDRGSYLCVFPIYLRSAKLFPPLPEIITNSYRRLGHEYDCNQEATRVRGARPLIDFSSS